MASTELQRAEAAHQRGDLAEAGRVYQSVLQRADGDHASAFYGLGTIASQQGNMDQAIEMLASAVAIQPDAADINYNYALCLQKSGRIEQATKVALHTAQLCRGDAVFSQPVIKLLLDLKQPAAVVVQLEELPRLSGPDMMLLARARGTLGDWDKSVAVLRQLAGQYSDSVEIARELSLAAGKLRDYPLAIESYQQYMALSRPVARDYLSFADLYLLARDIPHCAEQLALAGDAGADSAEYHVLKARVARLQGDDSQALVASWAALERQPELGQAWQIRVEVADSRELPGLIEQMSAIASQEGIPQYQHTLLYYALADANRAAGDAAAAAVALRSANSLQQSSLAERECQYDAQSEADKHQAIRARFGSIAAVAEPLPDQPVPIFIVGMPRSGTTLMEKILSQLPGVTAGGENEALGFTASQYQRDVNTGQIPVPAEMSASQWQQLARKYGELTGLVGDYLVDKMPTNYLHVGMILSMFPEAKVIQMRRDPRDVCLSIYSKPFPEAHNYACDPEALAHAFHEAELLMDHWQALAPERVIDVQFEQLVRDPTTQSQRVTHFCGLPWIPECLDFHRSVSPSFTFSEKQVRQAISDKPVGQWQAFEQDLAELFDAIDKRGL